MAGYVATNSSQAHDDLLLEESESSPTPTSLVQ